jgi:phosphoribosylamine-glycine ligase
VATGEDRYRTVGTSRAVALTTTAPTLEQARTLLAECAATVPVLEWRGDVGREAYLSGLSALVGVRGRAVESAMLPNPS